MGLIVGACRLNTMGQFFAFGAIKGGIFRKRGNGVLIGGGVGYMH